MQIQIEDNPEAQNLIMMENLQDLRSQNPKYFNNRSVTAKLIQDENPLEKEDLEALIQQIKEEKMELVN